MPANDKASMGSNSEPNSVEIGFVTVRLHPESGYVGGLLLLNGLARPLEFHCSLPLKPMRTQAILYGRTLDDFLCGEQIARTLLSKVRRPPAVVFTDTSAVLSLRHLSSIPLAFLDVETTLREDETITSLACRPLAAAPTLASFALHQRTLYTLEAYQDDASVIEDWWEHHQPAIDLDEPFGRILEALSEAHPSNRAA